MRTVNKSILVGHIGQDPEIRYTQSGTAVANLSLATTSRKKSQSGEWTETTHWHNLVAFGKLAEIVSQYVVKGAKLYVDGAIEYQEWEKDGIKRMATKIVANEISLLSSNQEPQNTSKNGAGTSGDDLSDDIPF